MQAYYDQLMAEKDEQDWKRELSQIELDQFEALQESDLAWADWPA
jgi:hypothetical protein